MKTLNKILIILSSQERNKLFILIIFFLITSMFDVLGIASILPFITILINPSIVESNQFLYSFYQYSLSFGVESLKDFLFILGVIVFLILITSLFLKALTTYTMSYYLKHFNFKISERLLEHYLSQPYSWFLSRNSSDLKKSVLSEVDIVVMGVIGPFINLIGQFLNSLGIILLLIFVDPKLAFYISTTFVLIYFFLFNSFKLIIKKNSGNFNTGNNLRFKILNEIFGSNKYLKASGLEKYFLKIYSDSVKPFYISQASSSFINQAPRYGIEAIAFGGMLVLILYLMIKFDNFTEIVPFIAMYAFAGYRLLPSFQQMYASLNELILAKPMIDNLSNEMLYLRKTKHIESNKKIELNHSIKLDSIYYTYPNRLIPSLNNINITLKAHSSIGIVGSTGSGKTTLIDSILCLLKPQKGHIEIDGNKLEENDIFSWQKTIGYVPQNIYLTDSSIFSNIAFGINNENIDQNLVKKVAKIAQIHEFISELPNKYYTSVGDGGVNISGGQKQRIGIARALYKNPKILILDEATNALDNITEIKVIDEIIKNKSDMTIITITHRLNTLKKCDQIILIDKGEIAAKGDYKFLKENNYFFSDIT